MIIVIPMAGQSKRFIEAGYSLPKYMLYIKDKSLFNLSVSSFKRYFKTAQFLFIARDLYSTELFINKECERIGLENFKILILDRQTKGQAETVYLGLNNFSYADEELLIFNIDTFRTNYELPENIAEWDGYLEVFKGDGSGWSYVKPLNNNSTLVESTAEKMPISNLCSTGLYYFKEIKFFKDVWIYYQENNIVSNYSNELYIAPMYNILILQQKRIHYNIISKNDVIFCGTPEEYHNLSAFPDGRGDTSSCQDLETI